MKFKYSKQFLKDLEKIEKGEPKRISQIKTIIEKIKVNPRDPSLHFTKLSGEKKLKIRYLVGKKYRILIEIIIEGDLIIFRRVTRRENFY